jgi:Short C-terminal domain
LPVLCTAGSGVGSKTGGLRKTRPRPRRTCPARIAQLKQLGELLSAGVLTQAEFEQQKARVLSS